MSLLLLFPGLVAGGAPPEAPPIGDITWPHTVPDFIPQWVLDQDDEEALVLLLASTI